MWKSSYFWVLLCDDGKHLNAFVYDWITLPRLKQLSFRGKAKNHHFGSKDLSFSVVALRLNFKQPRSQAFAPLTVAVVRNVTTVRVFGTRH